MLAYCYVDCHYFVRSSLRLLNVPIRISVLCS